MVDFGHNTHLVFFIGLNTVFTICGKKLNCRKKPQTKSFDCMILNISASFLFEGALALLWIIYVVIILLSKLVDFGHVLRL